MRRGFDYNNRKQGDRSQTRKSGHLKQRSLEKMYKRSRGTNKRKGGRPQAQENLIQAGRTLASTDGVLTAAIWRCRLELAKKKSFRDIEASKDAVEVAWRDFMKASSLYCVYIGEDPAESFPDPAEEVRRARYECKVLTDMMEQVVDKAEEYLESATKENSWDELHDDEDGGNELDAKVEQLSTMNEDSGEVEWSLAGHHRPEGMRNFEKV